MGHNLLMIAVIQTGGKQYLVKQGDILKIEKLPQAQGETVSFEVLMTADGTKLDLGTPHLVMKASAEILEQGRAAKIDVVKYKAKVRYKRRVGHRQPFTKVKMLKIV